ncbi:hypothetical protein BZA05DRAFT_392350 [Tricharina praecox]|uniref:uncharacterized protein n=1 Tax=Tricharina praecox TaxID=43433 RepID=UPI0022209BEF|nr:uncharacterized protein BZA05DRAFT_392350 [Tricharina praecox]KAI5854725.1 hypothetical protein BZA05DRAFT_392350 [Tricharina praecox]
MFPTATHESRIHEPYKPLAIEYLGTQEDVCFLLFNFTGSGAHINTIYSHLWRNNLVASSKRHNYLFVALRSHVHVYIPVYPRQRLPDMPHAILKSPTKIPVSHQRGDDPNGINSLTVGELGCEEVLVSAHADGDVMVWYTKDLKLMLQYNVGSSAWGVALHKERRRLAVSANSWKITVFELAAGGDQEMGVGSDEGGEVGGVAARADEGPRMPHIKIQGKDEVVVNCKILVGGHSHNIPNVTFMDDESGRWLASTSIDGTVIVWDVDTQQVVETGEFFGAGPRCWSVAYLSPQSFKPVNSMYEALDKTMDSPCGKRSVHLEDLPPKTKISWAITIPTDYYGGSHLVTGGTAWDITPALESIYTGYQGEGPTPMWGNMHLSEECVDSEDEDEDEEYDSNDASTDQSENEDEASEEEGSPGSQGEEHSEPPPPFALDEDAMWSDLQGERDENVVEVNRSVIPRGRGETIADEENEEDEWEEEEDDEDININSPVSSHHFDTIGSAVLPPGSGSEFVPSPQVPKPATEAPRPPLGFLFTTTGCKAALFPTRHLFPVVFCKRPACQAPPPTVQHRYLGHFDRLNMVVSVPELSLVVAASQQGRASIFRLTRCGDDYGMRLDTVLPRDRESVLRPGEERDVPIRPAAPLIGITVSPVQGQGVETAGGSGRKERSRGGGWRGMETGRRWRLVMVYIDGTVLSFELGRQGESKVGGLLGRKVCMV